MAKRWTKSKTIWFVVAIDVLAALEHSFAALQPYIPGNVYAYLLLALSVGAVALRAYTRESIGR